MIEKYLDADELKRLLSTLVAIVGCLIIAALFGVIVVPGLRNANKPEASTHVTPVSGETGWLDPTEFNVEKGKIIPPVDPKALIKPSAQLMARGKDLFEKNCTSCHGNNGTGDGPAAGSMEPKPRNFTAKEGWLNGRDMPGIYKTLGQGIPNSSMASFDYLTKKDRMALVHYVQSLGGFPDAMGSQDARQALSEELAAPGEKTNNKIPVSMAMTKLETEFTPPVPLVISRGDRSPGTETLRSMITDASRASQVLHASGLWRKAPAALARSILPDTPANGFSTKLATLEPSEWQALYDELLGRIKMK
jgi:mono/diheme cytochrome c family protein